MSDWTILCTTRPALLVKTGWLSINQLSCEVRLLEVWKAIYQEDYCLKNIFERVKKKSIGTRSSSQIKLKTLFKTRLRESSYQLPSVLLWNAAPPEITEAKSESQARAAIRKHVKNNIPIWEQKKTRQTIQLLKLRLPKDSRKAHC